MYLFITLSVSKDTNLNLAYICIIKMDTKVPTTNEEAQKNNSRKSRRNAGGDKSNIHIHYNMHLPIGFKVDCFILLDDFWEI